MASDALNGRRVVLDSLGILGRFCMEFFIPFQAILLGIGERLATLINHACVSAFISNFGILAILTSSQFLTITDS